MSQNSSQSECQLRFGDQKWCIAKSAGTAVIPTQPLAAISDFAAAIDKSFSEPIEFPPLDQAIVPDDKVAFVIDSNVPQMVSLASEAIGWFVSRGVAPSNIVVVVADDHAGLTEALHQKLSDRGLEIEVEPHDADNQEALAYLAANEASDPIYMNRRLVDADVVIPITCARSDRALDYLGPYGVFPLVSDRATRGKFYSLSKLRQDSHRQELQKWANQAAWWLGLLVQIQVVPASGDSVAAIHCGGYDDVEKQIQQDMISGWQHTADEQAMVIALIDGPAAQQTWLNVARAIFAAQARVQHGGSIVVCSSLSGVVGPGLKRLRQPDKSSDVIMQQLSSDAHDDAIAAAVILNATADHHVYLASDLRSSAVESLGLGVLEDQQQLERLLGQTESAVIMNAAQFSVFSE